MNLWYNIPCRLFGKILYFRRFRRWTETEGQYFLGSWQRLCVPLAWWLCVQAIRRGQKQPPADNPEEKPGESGSGNIPEVPSDSTENNGGNNTSNSTNTTTTTDNRTTDNSDNSRYSSTRDSNNTSTVNNYYQQEKQPSSSGESVQTIVVPVGNTGNGEPLQQTIRVESPEGTTATGSLERLDFEYQCKHSFTGSGGKYFPYSAKRYFLVSSNRFYAFCLLFWFACWNGVDIGFIWGFPP